MTLVIWPYVQLFFCSLFFLWGLNPDLIFSCQTCPFFSSFWISILFLVFSKFLSFFLNSSLDLLHASLKKFVPKFLLFSCSAVLLLLGEYSINHQSHILNFLFFPHYFYSFHSPLHWCITLWVMRTTGYIIYLLILWDSPKCLTRVTETIATLYSY